MNCIFCKIVSGDVKTRTITETERSLAFLDAFPLTKGHTLVIPKNHYKKVQEMTAEDSSDLFSLMYKILPKIDSLTGSTLIAVHNGEAAGQEVPHVHIHLIPRSSDDSAGPVHSMFSNRPKLSDAEFDEIVTKITQ
ncbi:MAG: HIT family protein [Candidatus Nitrosotenuis sp.]|jgi:histidine triad (HIT) family protein